MGKFEIIFPLGFPLNFFVPQDKKKSGNFKKFIFHCFPGILPVGSSPTKTHGTLLNPDINENVNRINIIRDIHCHFICIEMAKAVIVRLQNASEFKSRPLQPNLLTRTKPNVQPRT